MKKYTPKTLIELRENSMVQKWRTSNKNTTLIANPTVEEIRNVAVYGKIINKYISHMVSSILEKESKLYPNSVRVRIPEYYKNRYDVTPVEYTILINSIIYS